MRWKWTVQRKNEENFIETDQLQAGDRFLVVFLNGELHEAEVMITEDGIATCKIEMPEAMTDITRTEVLFQGSILNRCIRMENGRYFQDYHIRIMKEHGVRFKVKNERSEK